MLRTVSLSKLYLNAVVLRIESATLFISDIRLNDRAQIEIEKNGKRVEFYEQPLDTAHQADYSHPTSKHTFESKRVGSRNEPIWTTTNNDDYADGDIWVPLDEHDKSLTVRVRSGQFDGSFNLDLKENYQPSKDYDLLDFHGQPIRGCSLRLSYELGTQYEIDFRTGDPHLTAGTGTDVSNLNNLSKLVGVIAGNLYKTMKYFNPFAYGSYGTQKSESSIITFKINGTHGITRFFHCKNGVQEQIKCDKTNCISSSSKHKVFVRQNIGSSLSISVNLISNVEGLCTWFLEKLILKAVGNSKEEIIMPCYQWITGGRMKTLCMPYGYLPQTLENSPQLKKLYLERLNEIDVAKSKYQWDIEMVIPSYMRGTAYGAYYSLPLNEKFDDFKNKDFSYLISKGIQNAGLNAILTKFDKFDNLDDFDKLYRLSISNAISKPTFTANNWTDDAFFGWTYLAGTNPTHLTLCKTVPAQFLECKSLLKDSTGNPINIEEECKNGKVFLSDYTGLLKYDLHNKGVPSDPAIQIGRKYAAPCTCLLYVGDDKKLRPIGIQLLPDGEIYTPNDDKWQWMYAKMAVRNADAQYHQVVDHWLNAHALSETFSIALNRTVSRVHPVFGLVFPHIKYTIAINTLARRGLVNPGGYVNQLTSIGEHLTKFLVDAYSVLDFAKLDLPSRMAEQGFTRGNKGALIDFPYMDDGLLVWDAMFEFVGVYLRLYYKSDDDVVHDFEISALIKELQTKGHPNRPFPDVRSINELQNLLTTVMWTTSCHHSVVNFNQYQMYGFVPNYPLALFQPIPTTKDQINEKYIMQTLPGVKHSSLQILLLNVLSSYAENEEYLISERYMELIGEPKAVECLNNYKAKLREIDSEIKKRNEERVKRGFYEYKLLMPSHVPNSVAI